MKEKIIIIITILFFCFLSFNIFRQLEFNINYPDESYKIQVEQNIDVNAEQVKTYLEDNQMLIYRELEKIPFFLTNADQFNKMIYPKEENIYDYIAREDNAGVYIVDMNNALITVDQLESEIENNFSVNFNVGGIVDPGFNQIMRIKTLLVYIGLIILLIMQILLNINNKKNELFIKYVNGWNESKIIKQDAKRLCYLFSISYIIFMLILTTYYGYLTYILLLLIIFTLLIINLVIYVLVYIVYKADRRAIFKNKLKIGKPKIILTQVVTLVLTVIVVIFSVNMLITSVLTISYTTRDTIGLNKNKESLNSYLYATSQLDVLTEKDLIEYNKQMREIGAFVFGVLESDTFGKYILSELNYIDDLMQTDVDIPANSLLVPIEDKEEFEKDSQGCLEFDCTNLIYYEQDITTSTFEQGFSTLDNPIIQLQDGGTSTSFIIPGYSEDNGKEAEVDQIVANTVMDSNYSGGLQVKTYDDFKAINLRALISDIMRLVGSIILMFILIYLINSVYIRRYNQINQEKIFALKVNGYKLRAIYKEVLINYLICYLINILIIVTFSQSMTLVKFIIISVTYLLVIIIINNNFKSYLKLIYKNK